MANYTVDIEIDPMWVENFNGNSGMRLCMAKAVQEANGRETYNVIAKTADRFQPNMSFSWTERYSISGSKQEFRADSRISGQDRPYDIAFGQRCNLRNWNDAQIYDDKSRVDGQSFGFTNGMTCSVILNMKVEGNSVPVYISPNPIAPGESTLKPIPKVVFWFQNSVATSTMITQFPGQSITVTPRGTHSKVKFTREGRWTVAE